MRTSRFSVLASSVAIAALVLSGCSGDDENEPTAQPSSSTGSMERDEDGVRDDGSGDKQRRCDVDVEVTGSVDAAWKAKGQSVQPANQSPAAYYTAEKGQRLVQVFASGGDIDASSAVISIDGTTYTTDPQDPAGVEASEAGTSAYVDAQAVSTDGGSLDVVAEFTCGQIGDEKTEKKKSQKQSG